jgi:hypothetical protein
MATSLLLAAPLCFRRHGSTPFHQQPDDASSRLQFRSLVAAYQPRAVRSIDFFSCAQMSSATRSPRSTRRRRGATSSRSRESSSLITWRWCSRTAAEDDREAPSFLIESVEKGSEDTGVVRSTYIYHPSIAALEPIPGWSISSSTSLAGVVQRRRGHGGRGQGQPRECHGSGDEARDGAVLA